MAEKTTKKVTAKKTAVKKTISKPVAAKKAAAKPVAKKPAVKKVAAKPAVAPVAETHACGCDAACACNGKCKCKKGGFFKKLILFLIIFALGWVAAGMFGCDKAGRKMPKPEFENGCLVVKCPKLAEKVPQMDLNSDGCVSVEEFKASKKIRRPRRDNHPAPVPAPQMAE